MAFDREKQRKAGATYSIGMNIFALVFSIFWCCAVTAMGAWFMLIFGLGFVGLTAYRLVMCIKLAKSENREKSADPWDRPASSQTTYQPELPRQDPQPGSGYCPYCGASTQTGFQYCPSCGRRLT